jgi:uncharacterized membrane protein YkoI
MRLSRWLAACVVVGGICAVLSVSALAGKGEKKERDVSIDQVPAAVKATILKEAAGNKIDEIEEVSMNDIVLYYEAEWHADGKEIEIKVDPEGKVIAREVEDDDDDD